MKLIICEKPSVAKSVSSALGGEYRGDGFFLGYGRHLWMGVGPQV